MSLVRYAYQLIFGVWLGGLFCFAAIFTPVLFATLGPSPGAVGVVQSAITRLDWMTMIVCAALVLLAFAHEGVVGRRGWIRAGLLAGAMLLAATSLLVITPRFAELHEKAGGSAGALPADHPLRGEFTWLHRSSAGAMTGEMVLGLLAAAFFLRPKRPLTFPGQS